ncbi:MAG: hypothetical protein LBC54_01995 [Bacteroidales bacterium OttesenSCG-928-I14]|nr:hypothetical protein [Bacteroidales bacterium OttesenSCG-928-I14]
MRRLIVGTTSSSR